MLELTLGTVKSRLAWARRELRDKLLSSGNYFAPPRRLRIRKEVRAMANCEQYWDLISYSPGRGPHRGGTAPAGPASGPVPQCRALGEQLSGLGPELMELEAPRRILPTG